MKSWYEIKAKADISEIWIYDEIGFWGIGAKEFIVELNALSSKSIDMHINSPGGEVFDGAAMYNAIKRHPATVTTYIDGLAASIASVIALAGDTVTIAENGLYMVHNPWGMTLGTAEDMRKQADVLDKVRETMVGAYMGKSGKSADEIRALLDAETWMNAEETIAAGFADDMGDEMDMAACAKFVPVMAKMGFQRVPRALSGQRDTPTPKEMEKALREAGCSTSMAKSILAEGWQPRSRDAGPVPPEDPPRDVEPSAPRFDRTAKLEKMFSTIGLH